MYKEAILTTIEVFLAYFILIILLTAYMLRPLIRGRAASERLMICLVVGNVYVIHVVFLLSLFGRIRQIPLMITLVGLATLVRYLLEGKEWKQAQTRILGKAEALMQGAYGLRLFRRKVYLAIRDKCREWWNELVGRWWLERLLFLGIMGYMIYLYSHFKFSFVSYAAPDEEIHLYWIQSLIGGNIFPSGVYPHGFHNVCAALTVLFGFRAVSVIQVISVITLIWVMTMYYILLKRLCTQPYIAILGFSVFAFVDIYCHASTARYQFSVPQEYAMIFLYPMAIFLVSYLKKRKKEKLILFGLSFSLTLMIHFYVTLIALLLCLGIALGHLRQVFTKKAFLWLFACGLLSTLLAIAPMGVAYLSGIPMEQSMAWATNIMRTGESKLLDTAETAAMKAEQAQFEQMPFGEMAEHEIVKYMVASMDIFWIAFWLLILALLYGWIRIMVKRENPQTRTQFGFAIYIGLLIAFLLCKPIGLPMIMEPKRIGIFFAYASAALILVPFEIFYDALGNRRLLRKGFALIMLLLIGMELPMVLKYQLLHTSDYLYFTQTKGAMVAVKRILNEYEDFKWTVVSPVNERSIVLNNGYHYELIDFIQDQENYKDTMTLYIPTKYVFVFVEKMPITYYGNEITEHEERLTKRPEVSYVSANKEFEEYPSAKRNQYYIFQRDVVMSKAYYWAKKYSTYFPKEMKVYYEDNDIIVYRIEQNEYALNNFAIDYGVNSK